MERLWWVFFLILVLKMAIGTMVDMFCHEQYVRDVSLINQNVNYHVLAPPQDSPLFKMCLRLVSFLFPLYPLLILCNSKQR